MADSIVYNMDCLEYMKTVPDKYFDLAVVDPPYGDADMNGGNRRFHYGGNLDKYIKPQPLRFHRGDRWDKYLENETESLQGTDDELGCHFNGRGWGKKYRASATDEPLADGENPYKEAKKKGNKYVAWDVAPGPEYFDELFRISKNQIIWGGNYFQLPPTRCFLIWRKLTISENFTMAMCEYAWTSFNQNAKLFEYAPQDPERFHPTQKPVALYEWILSRYAKPGDKIFDSHLGSGSSRIAAYEGHWDFVGCEISKRYYDLQEKRFENFTAQTMLEGW